MGTATLGQVTTRVNVSLIISIITAVGLVASSLTLGFVYQTKVQNLNTRESTLGTDVVQLETLVQQIITNTTNTGSTGSTGVAATRRRPIPTGTSYPDLTQPGVSAGADADNYIADYDNTDDGEYGFLCQPGTYLLYEYVILTSVTNQFQSGILANGTPIGRVEFSDPDQSQVSMVVTAVHTATVPTVYNLQGGGFGNNIATGTSYFSVTLLHP